MNTQFERLDDLVTDHILLVPGLNGDGTEELYHAIDFAHGQIRRISVDIAERRDEQLHTLESVFLHGMPYGLTDPKQLLPYFLHPHSFFVTAGDRVVVSFKQAPYFRILDAKGGGIYPETPDYTSMLGSTNCEIDDDVVGFAEVAAADRYARYAGAEELFGGTIESLDLGSGARKTVATIPPFIRDTLHQLTWSPAGFYVGADMSLDVAATGIEEMTGGFDLDVYGAAEFPPSGFFVHDTSTGRSVTRIPETACAAHILIDPDDPAIFYVSCHNISKWTNQVIVHGPGALERYRFQDDELVLLGRFTAPDYLRVTSQVLFRRHGRVMAAVCSYPNKLFLIDTETMNVTARITLFDAAEQAPPFVCEKNTPAPLYLAVDDDARYAMLTGACEVFVVDLEDRQLVQRVQFAEKGSFAATAHIGLVPRRCGL